MAKEFGIYKCNVCGNIVRVLHASMGDLVCCDEKMELLVEKTADTSSEKHVPFIEKIDGGYKVKIGENAKHPMTDEHYIEFIELMADGKSYFQYLKPGDEPEAVFMVDADKVTAREYCNVHGLWKNSN